MQQYQKLSVESAQHIVIPMGEAFKARLTDGFQQQLPQLQPTSLCQISITPHCTTVVKLTRSNIISKL